MIEEFHLSDDMSSIIEDVINIFSKQPINQSTYQSSASSADLVATDKTEFLNHHGHLQLLKHRLSQYAGTWTPDWALLFSLYCDCKYFYDREVKIGYGAGQ
jgi:hypothetical protein